MRYFQELGHAAALQELGLTKIALVSPAAAGRQGRGALSKLKSLFGPAKQTPLHGPGLKPRPSSAPITVEPPGMVNAPRVGGGRPPVPAPSAAPAPGAATPPPTPSQWVPPGASAPRAPAPKAPSAPAPKAPKADAPKPTKETSLLGTPGAQDVGAAEAAFGGPGQPGRASRLLGKAKQLAVPAGLLGGSAALIGAGGGEDPGQVPVQQPYYSEMGYY